MSKAKLKKLKIESDYYEYLDIGKGDVIFAFYGVASSKDCFSSYVEKLSNHYRLIIPDIPGHQNISLDGFENIEDIVKYFEKFIIKLKHKRFALLGFSLGGVIARSLSNRLHKSGKTVPTVIWSSPISKNLIKKFPRILIFFGRFINPKLLTNMSRNEIFWKIASIFGIKLSKCDQEAFRNTDLKFLTKYHNFLFGRGAQKNHEHQLYIFDKKDIFIKPPTEPLINTAYIIGGGHFGKKIDRNRSLDKIVQFFNKHNL